MVTLIATEISGLTDPTYKSGGASKKYVEETFYPSGLGATHAYISGLSDVSIISSKSDGDVLTWIDGQSKWSSQAVTAGGITGWQAYTQDGGIDGFTGTYAVSGDGALTISVKGYDTISGLAKSGANLSLNSGAKYSTWYTSGNLLGIAYDHSQDNTQAHSDYLLNNADDETDSLLTSTGGGFRTTTGGISGAKMSGGTAQFGTISDIVDITNVDTITKIGTITEVNTINLNSLIYHLNDTSTYIGFGPEDELINFKAGDKVLMQISGGSAPFRVHINPTYQDCDFIVNANVGPGLYFNADKNQFAIAKLTPTYTLDVSGSIHAHSAISGAKFSGHTIEDAGDASITTPKSGQVLTYKADNSRWENEYPSLTYNQANIRLSSQQAITIAKFFTANKKVYLWQAAACNSGGATVSGLCVELRSGSTSVYKTSSATLEQGDPLASSDGGDTEIRIMYSGTQNDLTGIHYGNGFMNVSVY
jgi:hypothetical protein